VLDAALFQRLATALAGGKRAPFDFAVVDEAQDLGVPQMRREERRDTVSVFNGRPPLIRVFEAEAEESQAVGEWLSARVKDGIRPHEVAVFVRSAAQIGRAEAAVKAADLPSCILDERVETAAGHVFVGTMHLAKGLEFRAVAVMACDEERQLLYVACTRARDSLNVTAGDPARSSWTT